MYKSLVVPGALALAFCITPRAWGAADADLEAIRKEIRDLKASYEGRIQALEQRLKDAEARAMQAAAPVAAMPPRAAASSAMSAFNPAISLVLQGTYANLSRDPNEFAIAGFAPGGEIGPGRRGFSLAESELQFSANVDDKFAGNLIVALTPENEASVEEAYATYLGAPFGLTPKFGRFFSGIGYLNEQHQHAWDFVDAPLAYQAFLGGKYVQDGLQLKWVAPLEHFVEFGAEAGNGDAFPGGPRNKNGIGAGSLYVHTGGDIGTSHSWRAGVSALQTRPEELDRRRLAIADFVWKYAPDGNARERNFKLQGEYFSWREPARQSGWYLQAVYQFMRGWRLGARYERLDPGEAFMPTRSSAMLDWSPSEFSRLRLQFARSKVQPDMSDNQWFLQYILSLGAHGAHRY